MNAFLTEHRRILFSSKKMFSLYRWTEVHRQQFQPGYQQQKSNAGMLEKHSQTNQEQMQRKNWNSDYKLQSDAVRSMDTCPSKWKRVMKSFASFLLSNLYLNSRFTFHFFFGLLSFSSPHWQFSRTHTHKKSYLIYDWTSTYISKKNVDNLQ